MDDKKITVFTIGYKEKTAEQFFEKLRSAGVKRVVDVRLKNTSHLAGFAKKVHLEYFLKKILVDVGYVELPILAPSKELFGAYVLGKENGITWKEYEERFNDLMLERHVEKTTDPAILDGDCLLCSEPKPDKCHRRLVVEYLQRHWGNLVIKHL